MAGDPSLRECPTCHVLCSPVKNNAGAVVPEMCCSQCGTLFCYYHANAHPPGSKACQEYTRLSVKAERANLMSAGTKALLIVFR